MTAHTTLVSNVFIAEETLAQSAKTGHSQVVRDKALPFCLSHQFFHCRGNNWHSLPRQEVLGLCVTRHYRTSSVSNVFIAEQTLALSAKTGRSQVVRDKDSPYYLSQQCFHG